MCKSINFPISLSLACDAANTCPVALRERRGIILIVTTSRTAIVILKYESSNETCRLARNRRWFPSMSLKALAERELAERSSVVKQLSRSFLVSYPISFSSSLIRVSRLQVVSLPANDRPPSVSYPPDSARLIRRQVDATFEIYMRPGWSNDKGRESNSLCRHCRCLELHFRVDHA